MRFRGTSPSFKRGVHGRRPDNFHMKMPVCFASGLSFFAAARPTVSRPSAFLPHSAISPSSFFPAMTSKKTTSIHTTASNFTSTTAQKKAFKPNQPNQSKRQKSFYAVQRGRDGFSGILNNWPECQRVVHGVKGAIFKAFKTRDAAVAFMQQKHDIPRPRVSSAPSSAPATTASKVVTRSSARGTFAQPSPSNRDFAAAELYTNLTSPEDLANAAPDPCDEAPKDLVVYTDGACSANGMSHARGGYGVYFGEDSPYNVAEPFTDSPTSQRAELTAALEAMRLTLDHGLVASGGKLRIRTDSKVC